jgi:hypothetical protein
MKSFRKEVGELELVRQELANAEKCKDSYLCDISDRSYRELGLWCLMPLSTIF